MRPTRISAAGLVLSASLLASCASDGAPQRSGAPDPSSATSPSPGERAGERPSPPERAQKESDYDDSLDFTVTTFDGDAFTLADHAGVPVVLNFWESW